MASEEHKSLAAYIKSVHQSLRIKSRAVGPDQAWLQHCQQTDVLEEYADSMQKLATEFWEKNNCKENDLCRIQWVVNQCQEYFYKGGSKLAASKESKLNKTYFGNPTEQQMNNLAENSTLKLIDVGSCYNPFLKFNCFDVTAIDLMPATSEVIKCDFLTVETSENYDRLNNTFSSLPLSHFDVVVFSLLLEYLPTSKQRFICCEKAFKILKPGGLLFILTPDSKHATANSTVMKSWRYSLASIGLFLVSYQKLKHLHCMAYRKCFNPDVPKVWFSKQCCDKDPEELMYIPQDFHEYENVVSEKDEHVVERTETDNKLLAEIFSDFPDSDLF